MRVAMTQEGVMEIATRAVSSSSSKRGLERKLEGWKLVDSGSSSPIIKSVPWSELGSLRNLVTRSRPDIGPSLDKDRSRPEPSRGTANQSPVATSDPMASLSFNLNLTDEQHAARAQVPLPYAHEGKKNYMLNLSHSLIGADPCSGQVPDAAAILYDPDSADDVDDDDPDEDLDI